MQHDPHPGPLDAEQHQRNVQSSRPAGDDSVSGEEKRLTGGGRAAREVKGRSKLDALFGHPLYSPPRPQLQEDDWLLRVRTGEHKQDEGREDQEEEEAISADSEW